MFIPSGLDILGLDPTAVPGLGARMSVGSYSLHLCLDSQMEAARVSICRHQPLCTRSSKVALFVLIGKYSQVLVASRVCCYLLSQYLPAPTKLGFAL